MKVRLVLLASGTLSFLLQYSVPKVLPAHLLQFPADHLVKVRQSPSPCSAMA